MSEPLAINFEVQKQEPRVDISQAKAPVSAPKKETDTEKLFSDNALVVLKRRYLMRDNNGHPTETPDTMLHRIANAIAASDSSYTSKVNVQKTAEKFYQMLRKKDFLPNSPTIMNAGRELGQLSACFVLPVDDSMESIFQTLKDTALIHKSGGGTGFSFSRIRPKKSIVKTTSGVASGPVSFMKVYNASTEAVKQGGTRRGANMGILRVDHPDILEFIDCKKNNTELTNFNISVAVTNDFMEKVRKREQYELINPVDRTVSGTLNAADVFKLIARNAWGNGDPGIIFIDKINKMNPTPKLGEIEATNPCGEQPLLPNEACNLGSINLSNFIDSGKIDYDRMNDTIQTAIHFLDNVIDVNKYPLKKIDTMVKKSRKIGLGVMGFADVLIKLNIPYNSEEALHLADELMSTIYKAAREASIKLGESRGTFPAWNDSIYFPDGPKLRNSTFATIAPTGTISMLADCSSGIEPIFSLVFTKRVMDGTDLLYVNPYFEEICKKAGVYSEQLMKKVAAKGSIQNIDGIPDSIKKVYVTAHDITPEWHVRMQAAFQKWTDSAVSKTCNFPQSATVQNVMDAYWLAYEADCKGITIYRDGSRDEQVLYIGDNLPDKATHHTAAPQPIYRDDNRIHPRVRPQNTRGVTKRIRTGLGTLYVTINEDDTGLCEVFTNIGKAGSQAQVESEAISRLISLALRSGIDTRDVIKQLKGIGGPSPIWENGTQILSTPDAIAKALEWYLEEREGKKKGSATQPNFLFNDPVPVQTAKTVAPTGDGRFQIDNKKTITTCPDCGSTVYHESGCVTCASCGFSKC